MLEQQFVQLLVYISPVFLKVLSKIKDQEFAISELQKDPVIIYALRLYYVH